MKINRVRNPKTCLRTDTIAFMHFCELAGFDPAILQKPDENFPACWTIVKWLDLTCSVYRIKVHSGATLNLNFLCVTRSLSPIGPAGCHRRLWPKRAVVIAGHENNRPSKPRLNVPALSGARDSYSPIRQTQANFLSPRDPEPRQSGR
jgi:hypothetical protein